MDNREYAETYLFQARPFVDHMNKRLNFVIGKPNGGGYISQSSRIKARKKNRKRK